MNEEFIREFSKAANTVTVMSAVLAALCLYGTVTLSELGWPLTVLNSIGTIAWTAVAVIAQLSKVTK